MAEAFSPKASPRATIRQYSLRNRCLGADACSRVLILPILRRKCSMFHLLLGSPENRLRKIDLVYRSYANRAVSDTSKSAILKVPFLHHRLVDRNN